MALAVDRYELGPIGTNCYVVRAPARRAEAVVVDPGGDAAELRLELARARRAVRRDPRHAHPLRPHRRRRRPRRGTGAPVSHQRARGARCSSGRTTSTRAWAIRPCAAGGPARGRRDARARRHHVRDAPRPGPLARAPRLPRRRRALLRRRALRRLGRPHRPALRRLGHAGRRRSARCSSGSRRRPSSTPATARRRRSATSSRPQPVPGRAPRRVKFEAPRGTHDILPADAPLWRRVIGEAERLLRALRLPADPDAGLRGHRALRADVGRGLGRRAQGDVHVRRPRRPLADAAAGGHGADLPRLPRARPPPRAAAAEALHDRADVPLRPPRQRPLPRALAALGRGDRLGRSRRSTPR